MNDRLSGQVEDRGETELVYRHAGDETAAEGAITAVSELTETDPTAMEPLFEVVDPGALNSLCRRDPREGRARRVGFQFNGCAVTVYAEGRTEVSQTQ